MGCFTYTYNVIQPISVDLGNIADSNPNCNIRLFYEISRYVFYRIY